ncbi:hypothetical protein HN947_01510, partial [Candidatus Woesearchaeota archaeon]|nr:hypothetical protein [Candidatus Woesearchaeota archaeon]
MLFNKKGQGGSMEVLIIVGLVLVVTIPLIGTMMNNLNERMGIESRVQTAVELSNALLTVSNLGVGNSLQISSSYDYQIIENEIYVETSGGQEITIPILPTVEDDDAGRGVIQIIKTSDGIFFGNAPEILEIEPNPAKIPVPVMPSGGTPTIENEAVDFVLRGKYFDENTKVYLDFAEVTTLFVSEEELTFTGEFSSFGEHTVQAKTSIESIELESGVKIVSVEY